MKSKNKDYFYSPYVPVNVFTQHDFQYAKWCDVESWSVTGMLAPHGGSNDIELALMLIGRKPAMLATGDLVYNITKFNIPVESSLIPRLAKIDNKYYRYVVYPPGCSHVVDQINAAYALYHKPSSKKLLYTTISHHIAMGIVLGYSKDDVAKYIVHNFTKEQFEKWTALVS